MLVQGCTVYLPQPWRFPLTKPKEYQTVSTTFSAYFFQFLLRLLVGDKIASMLA